MSSRRIFGPGTRRPKALRAGLIVREVGGETLVYDTGRHRMHCLGPLVARVWRACTGRRTVAQVSASVCDSQGQTVDEAAVELALLRLRRAHLVDRHDPPLAASRRELLRRAAGLGGLTLLTLGAPTVLQAATCTTEAECHALPNASCTGLPCCPGPGAPPGSRCNRPGGGPNCDCR